MTINGANGINVNNQTRTIGIKSGGADFNLSPDVNLAGKVSIGFDTITTGSLGNAAAGFLSDLRSGGAANVQSGNLTKAQEILDADHFGLDKVKDRIVEYLAVQSRANKLTGPILCLVGPPCHTRNENAARKKAPRGVKIASRDQERRAQALAASGSSLRSP